MTIASRTLFHFKNSLTTTTKSISLTTKSNPQQDWRNQFKQTQLISQISTFLLQTQKTHWPSFLKQIFTSKLTPFLFLKILKNTQKNPQVSLHFFHYAKNNLGFQPDAKVLVTLVSQLLGSGQPIPAKPILDSLIQTYPPTQIVEFLKVDKFCIFSSILEWYCNKGMIFEAFMVYSKAKEYGYVMCTESCNLLLELLCRKNDLKLPWCYYGCLIRNDVQENVFTWSLIAQLLCKDGKFERIVRIVDKGLCSSAVVYNLLVECYSKRGDFEAAFGYLNMMCRKNIDPSFSTFSSILDGACKYRNVEVVESVMSSMVAKEYLPKVMLGEYDSVIQKLSDLGKTYAAELFFREASEKKIELRDNSYGSMLRALSKEGRVGDAILMYSVILERNLVVSDKCYSAFLSVLCDENPLDEVSSLLKELIGRGFIPPVSQVSKFIVSQCEKRKWKEAEELMNVILQRGLKVESFCCSSLVRHYCFSRRIDSAISLHTELERLGVSFDVETYGILLDRLFKSRRHEEAVRIFDYMRSRDILSSESFSVTIRGLCQEKEFRKAMRLHDEMLKLGLKPDKKAYTHLISGFG